MLNKEEILKKAISEIPVVAGNLTMKGTGYATDLRANFIKGYTQCQQTELPEVAIGFAEWTKDWGWIMNTKKRIWSKWPWDEKDDITTSELFKQYLEWLKKQKEGV